MNVARSHSTATQITGTVSVRGSRNRWWIRRSSGAKGSQNTNHTAPMANGGNSPKLKKAGIIATQPR